jgi:hypothetical protein
MQQTLSTRQKALQINLDVQKFGTFAEIGAGQEVARWFFHVGRASGTVAKTISAYDMSVGDHLYGPTDRYVSPSRLETMLTREFEQLIQHVPQSASRPKTFFTFADTVATRTRRRGGHGWMGVRFHHHQGAVISDIVIHFILSDPETVREQEAVGILGVNLIHAALYFPHDPRHVVNSLLDGLSRRRIEVDMIRFSGPAFGGVDNRLMSLQLLQSGLTDAALFMADGEVVQPSEVLFGRSVVIERGSFRPVTNVTVDMLACAERQQQEDHPEPTGSPVVLMEMTLNNLLSADKIDPRDFLDRVDLLAALDKSVLISNYPRFDGITGYLRRATQGSIAMAMGVPTLEKLFDRKYYLDLPGGILQGLGGLFQGKVRLLVYPTKDVNTGEILTVDSIAPGLQERKLFEWLRENGFIEPIRGFAPAQLEITPAEVLRRLQTGDPTWREMVPQPVAELIERRQLFTADI